MQTKVVVFEVPLADAAIVCLMFLPGQSKEVLVVAVPGVTIVYNVETKTQTRKIVIPAVAQWADCRDRAMAFAGRGGRWVLDREGQQRTFEEGAATVLAIRFSPHSPDVVATADETGLVRIWNTEALPSATVGRHRGRAVCLAFHLLCDTILASGGETGEIQIHDIKRQGLLATYVAHGTTVTALHFSPDNPNLLISCGADSSLKFWTLDGILMGDFLAGSLRGQVAWIRPLEGYLELMKLAHRARKKEGEKLVFEADDIVHTNDIARITARTVRDSLSSSGNETRLIKRAIKNKEKMIAAAKLELYMGNVKRYCELMFASGEYDRAVAAAPAVSYGFWSEMVKQRAKLRDNPNDVANCMLTTGQVDAAIDLLLGSGSTDSAFLVAAAARNGAFKVNVSNSAEPKEKVERPYIDREFTDGRVYLEYKTASARAHASLVEGAIYPAAAAFLSIGDVVSAVSLLIKHGQTVTAYMIDRITNAQVPQASRRLYMLCIQSGLVEELLTSLSGAVAIKEEVAIALPFKNPSMRESLFKRFELKSPDEYAALAGSAMGVKQLQLLVLAGKKREAAAAFLETARGTLRSSFVEMRDLTKWIETANLDDLEEDVLGQIVGVSLYFAIYEAMWKGYKRIMRSLVETFQGLASKPAAKWLAPFLPEIEKVASIVKNDPSESRIYSVGHTFLNVVNLGTGYDPLVKYGKQYYLDNGTSKLKMEEALMWFDVTPYSPANLKVRHYIV
jgi:hypothetical protein